jgi:hypothetical protein
MTNRLFEGGFRLESGGFLCLYWGFAPGCFKNKLASRKPTHNLLSAREESSRDGKTDLEWFGGSLVLSATAPLVQFSTPDLESDC